MVSDLVKVPSRDKNQREETPSTVNTQLARDHEIAVTENNECIESRADIVVQVDNNFQCHSM